MRTIATSALAVTAALMAAAPMASAHVSAQPSEQPAGGFTVMALRVPNERPEATEQVEVQFPDGITSVRYQPVPGWTVEVKMETLDEPIDDGHGGEVTEQVDTVTFSGGEIKDGEFQDFPLSFRMLEDGEQGDTVFFPAVQTYAGGEEVAWTEKPASEGDDAELERPAPAVTLVAAEGGHGADHAEDESASDHDSASDDEGGTGDRRDDAALALALAAFVVSILVWFRGMRRTKG